MKTCKECLYEGFCYYTVTFADRSGCKQFRNKADYVKVKHGKWKVKRDDYDTQYITCSVCKEEFYPGDNEFDFDFIPKFCQNCGAKMDGGKDNGNL